MSDAIASKIKNVPKEYKEYEEYEECIDTSYSICVDNSRPGNNIDSNEPLKKYTLPRKVYAWVDDDTAFYCYGCNDEFTFMLRKHHCRLCGKIFCYECSKFRDVIPDDLLSSKKCTWNTWNDYLTSYVVNLDLEKHRVCKFCHKIIQKVSSIKKVIEVFRIFDLDIKELKMLSNICKVWKHAVNYNLSLFREIQYKLPMDTYSDAEKKILWLNVKYFSGHNRYLVHLLKICGSNRELEKVLNIMEKKKCVDCWSLMCSSNCKEVLTPFDSINILEHCFGQNKNTDLLKRVALRYMVCCDREFKCYIPYLVYNLRNDNHAISEFVIKRCMKNFDLLNSLYWELQLYSKEDYHSVYSEIMTNLKKMFSEQQFVKLLQGNSIVRMMDDISRTIYDDGKNYDDIKDKFKIKNEMTLPTNPDISAKSVCLDKIKIKKSATNPVIIPFLTTDNSVHKLMYKREDVRKDQIIMHLIYLINLIVSREENIDLGMVDYNILPTSKTSGVIEIIDESDTIYTIQEKMRTTILNYILEYNGDMKVKDLKKRFVKTTAGYCVVTYLLGVGDRHLDNIMVTRSGKLFHIDFGYILGKDPVFSNPGIRITNDMIDAIGGLSSLNYVYFKELCTKIFNAVRRNIDIFINILTLLPKISDIELSEDDIKEQIIKRFIPGENYVDAKLHLVNQLEKANYTDKIKDWCHYHSKEKTISSTVGRLSSAISSLLVESPKENS